MSQLSHEIRAQELLARSVADELRAHAQTVRRLSGTSWQSSAGDTFRRSLDHLSQQIDACQDEAEKLAAALADHARQVSENEQMVSDFLDGLGSGISHLPGALVNGATGLWHEVEHGASTAWGNLENGAEELQEGFQHATRTLTHPHPPTSGTAKTVLDARSPW